MFRDLEPTGDAFMPSNADAALIEFAVEVHDYCRGEHDPAERFRNLRFARTEMSTTQKGLYVGVGKNVAIRSFIERALDVIDCELELVGMELEHPEKFACAIPETASEPEPKSSPASTLLGVGSITSTKI